MKFGWIEEEKDKVIYMFLLKMSYLYLEYRIEMYMIKVKMFRSKDWKFNWKNIRGI